MTGQFKVDSRSRQTLGAVVVALLVMVLPTTVLGCAFHCERSPCGATPSVVSMPFYVANNQGNLSTRVGPAGLGVHQMFQTLNLTNRNISQIQPGAFSCWNSTSTTLPQAVALDGNPLRVVPDGNNFGGIQIISLQNCSITTVTAAQIGSFNGAKISSDGSASAVYLSKNPISSLPPGLFSENSAQFFTLDLSGNDLIKEFPQKLFSGASQQSLLVYLNDGVLESLPLQVFDGFAGNLLNIQMNNNSISALPDSMLQGFGGSDLIIGVINNNITELQDALFSGASSNLNRLMFNAAFNGIGKLGTVFNQVEVFISTVFNVSHNSIDSSGLKAMTGSYNTSWAQMAIDARYNNIKMLPDFLFDGMAYSPQGIGLRLDVSFNPLQSISPNVFLGNAILSGLVVDVSNPTTSTPLEFPAEGFHLEQGVSFHTYSTFIFIANGTRAGAQATVGFNGFLPQNTNCSNGLDHGCGCGPTCNLTLIFTGNQITAIRSGDFAHASFTSLNLANNQITLISNDAFNNTESLKELILTNNNITVLPLGLESNAPTLARLVIDSNSLLAIPITNNHILQQADGGDNILTCGFYMPSVTGCSCSPGYHMSENCGYVRCTPNPNGCPANLDYNSSSCQAAPWSSCVNASTVPHDYYDMEKQEFRQVTPCATYYRSRSAPLPAYQVVNSTSTTDRLCSICSTCPENYRVSAECTLTEDTTCTKKFIVELEDIVIFVIFVVVALVCIVFYYASHLWLTKETKKLSMRLKETEITLKHVSSDRKRLERAWSIDRADIHLGELMGNGAAGLIHRGRWGINVVTIKILLAPIIDEMSLKEFVREVDFLKWVRHPNLVDFHGTGVGDFRVCGNTNFLVSEYFEKGSLRQLFDTQAELDWPMRVQIASDIADGMWYLHFIDVIHGDLRPDNCMLNGIMRCKVGDFGTSRETAMAIVENVPGVDALRSLSCSSTSSVESESPLTKTMPLGSGSWRWMAPEALCGLRIEELPKEVDSYSFAMILLELWSGNKPWVELEGAGEDFIDMMTHQVMSGHRPELPETEAPQPLETLITLCWAANYAHRLSFRVVSNQLTALVDAYRDEGTLNQEKQRGLVEVPVEPEAKKLDNPRYNEHTPERMPEDRPGWSPHETRRRLFGGNEYEDDSEDEYDPLARAAPWWSHRFTRDAQKPNLVEERDDSEEVLAVPPCVYVGAQHVRRNIYE